MLLYFPDHLFVWGWLAALTGLWLHARNRYDVVYTTSYPESAHLPGIVLGLLGVNWIADYRYGGPFWIKRLVGYRKSAVRDRVDQRYQRFVLRRADRVVTQSEPLRRDFCETFSLDPSHICVIPNGYDERDFDGAHSRSAAFPKQDDEVHLLHVGAMEGVSSAERTLLVDALNRLADDLRGNGRALVLHAIGNDLFREPELKGTMRFSYHYEGVVRHGDVPSYLRAADCLLLSTITTSAGNDAIKGFIPGKLWEYLRADRPILMVGQKEEVWRIIDDIGVGLHLGLNGDHTCSAETLIGRITAARSLHPKVETFSWKSRADSFQQVLLRVASGARGIG
jgi:glycosyltransferase involved in cell wall biosynthesis